MNKVSDMDKVYSIGLMVKNIRVTGTRINVVILDDLFTLMVMYMRENGSKTQQKVMVYI